MQALQVAEDLLAQIEHHLLPRPLHEIGLGELQQETRDQKSHVDRSNLRNASAGVRTQPAPKPRDDPFAGSKYRSIATLVR